MGWKGPRTLDVTLPEELRAKARRRPHRDLSLHRRRARRQRIITEALRPRHMERLEHMGPSRWPAPDRRAPGKGGGRQGQARPGRDAARRPIPPDLVLRGRRARRSTARSDTRPRTWQDWVDDVHPDVLPEHVALEMIHGVRPQARGRRMSRGKAPAVRPIPRRVRSRSRRRANGAAGGLPHPDRVSSSQDRHP